MTNVNGLVSATVLCARENRAVAASEVLQYVYSQTITGVPRYITELIEDAAGCRLYRNPHHDAVKAGKISFG